MTFSKKDILADVAVVLLLGAVAAGIGYVMRPSLGKIWTALHLPVLRSQAVPAGSAADYQWDVETLDGKKVPFATLKGKVVFLNFWATWCGPCKLEMPSIEKLYQRFEKEDGVFLLVSEEAPEVLRAFVQKSGLRTPVYSTRHIPEFFRVRGLPTTFILSRSGQVALSHVGPKMWDRKGTVKLIRSLLAQDPSKMNPKGTD